jgi:hypothetical protein
MTTKRYNEFLHRKPAPDEPDPDVLEAVMEGREQIEKDNGYAVELHLGAVPDDVLTREIVSKNRYRCEKCNRDFTILTIIYDVTMERSAKLIDTDSGRTNDTCHALVAHSNDGILRLHGGLCKKCWIEEGEGYQQHIKEGQI